jgi:hypothetical protein
MARGFESKDVEFQQAERERGPATRAALTPAQRDMAQRRAVIELSLTRMRADIDLAHASAHKTMLDAAIATLEAELASLQTV